jgi:hypothetical protein
MELTVGEISGRGIEQHPCKAIALAALPMTVDTGAFALKHFFTRSDDFDRIGLGLPIGCFQVLRFFQPSAGNSRL